MRGLDAEQLARAVGAAVDAVAARAGAAPGEGRAQLVPAGDEDQLDLPRLYRTEEDRDLDFNGAVADDACRRRVGVAGGARSRTAEEFVDAAPTLDVEGDARRAARSTLREVLVHMIEEYARHCGHADLLRECIDGRTGQ